MRKGKGEQRRRKGTRGAEEGRRTFKLMRESARTGKEAARGGSAQPQLEEAPADTIESVCYVDPDCDVFLKKSLNVDTKNIIK